MQPAPVLLLSDLHLPPRPSPYRQALIDFLDGPAHQASVVYILGDLFDAWIGDDIGLQNYAAECASLKALSDSGVAVYFQHGNRDFLIGKRFATATGVQLLPESKVVELPIGRTLLMHGDALCIDDIAYQRFRHWIRKRWVKSLLVSLPAKLRRRIAGGLKQASSEAKSDKIGSIMDVNEAAAREAMAAHGVSRMIHGHTHRPGRYLLQADNTTLERIVLADWRPQQMEYLVCDADGLHRELL